MRLRWKRSQFIWPLLLGSLLATGLMTGCFGPASSPSDRTASNQEIPFHDGNASPGPTLTVSSQEDGPSGSGVPFHDNPNLPVGTLLTVRLSSSVSADKPGAGATFEAVVDKPVVVEGLSVIPKGAIVSGRIESARVSAVERDRGYIRLTLDVISLDGRDLHIQTSSLFARAETDRRGSDDPLRTVHLQKGRQLTFRLTEPVYLASEPALSAR